MKHRLLYFVAGALLAVGCGNAPSQQEAGDSTALHQGEMKTQSLIIQIEERPAPKGLLEEKTLEEILPQKPKVLAHSRCQGPLVDLPHPFFNGMHLAYAEHRPFVLSPDAVWLLICQGFSNHVNTNAEELRPLFVDFDGKKQLTVYTAPQRNLKSEKFWKSLFPKFTKQIADYVGSDLVSTLGSQFSTSTPVTTVASQITIMASMQAYFEYEVVMTCGIPYVILEGTPDDWQRIVDNVGKLRKYKLDWWIDEIEPILKEIVEASKGKQDPEFWRGMFKLHDLEPEMCGDHSTFVDGWIVKFYPYLVGYDVLVPNKTFTLYDLSGSLPAEMVSVPLAYEHVGEKREMLALHAGFVGLTQDHETFAIRPEIGWYITGN